MKKVAEKKFIQKARDAYIPFYATIELTYRCNLSCIHCYLGKNSCVELSMKEVCIIIDQLASCGTLELTFTGGEALIRDDFFEIAAYARKKSMACSLLSNGTLINQEIAGKIKDLHFLDVTISLYGPESHDRITGVKGSFVNSYQAVKLLRKNGVRVQVKTPVMNLNVHEIEHLDRMCAELNVDFLPNPSITPKINGSKNPLKYRLNDTQLNNYLIYREEAKTKTAGFTRLCNAGRCIVSISPEGDVFPCVALRQRVGNLKKDSFSRVWHYSPYLKWLRNLDISDFKECFACPLRKICDLCPGETLAEEGDLLAARKEACRITKARKEVLTI